MVQYIQQPSIFGRIGTGLGQGFAETFPKEMERGRLAEGLKQFSSQAKDMTPMEQAAYLYGIPGVVDRPQLVKSLSDLAMMESQGRALGREGDPMAFGGAKSNSIQQQQAPNLYQRPGESFQPASPKEEPTKPPSLTTGELSQKVQEGYIPPSQQQKMAMAKEKFNRNPSLYKNDPQEALASVEREVADEERQQQAYENKYRNLSKLQDNVVTRLQDYSDRLNVKVPANVFSQVEDEAIQATKPKSEGGGGLTEQEAMKVYGKKLDDISREYADLNSLGSWSTSLSSPSKTISQLKALQNSFKKRGDTENMADTLISNLQISPQFAYAIAQPVKNDPELSKELSKIKAIEPSYEMFETVYPDDWDKKTLEVSKSLAKKLTPNTSPQAVAYELQKKNYNPLVWIDYLVENQKDLNLTVRQAEQLLKPFPEAQPYNDWWLQSFSGIGE